MTNDKNEWSCRILVSTHREYRMPEDPLYLPIHAGAALSRTRLPYQRDDEGCSISERNPCYCELTALYWAWKNLDCDYVGLCHYRRYFRGSDKGPDPFDRILTTEELRPLLGRVKVFVPRRRRYYIETLFSHYEHTHFGEHLERTRQIMERQCPEYLGSFDRVMRRRSGHMFNLMIMERSVLDRYCTWLFSILDELWETTPAEDYSFFQGRFGGRVGELILNVWLDEELKSGRLSPDQIRVLPFIYMEKINWVRKIGRFLRAKFFGVRYENS